MAKRVVVDPVTRIEGHLRIEAILDDNRKVTNALSSGTMWRGIEIILQGRDPREAWAFTERICGVCTTVHALASVRAVENALSIQVPRNADIVRNMMFLTQYVQDHVIHFYHLHALDWVDVVSALKADPKATAELNQKISPKWAKATPGYFSSMHSTLKKFVESGQLGIFQNAYWGHPEYKLPPEANLMAVAHYLEALQWQKEIIKIHTLFGGKNPHPNYLVGGMACTLTPDNDGGIGMTQLAFIKDRIREAIDFVEQVYLPDLLAIAGFYPEWTTIGGGLGNFMAYGDVPQAGIAEVSKLRFPRGVVLKTNLAELLPLDPGDTSQIREEVTHSYYEYPGGEKSLHPFDGVTQPRHAGPKPPYDFLDEKTKYSWVKTPRWKGHAMEVGPLARLLVGYAAGNAEIKEVVNEALGVLKLPATALISTLGRTAARGLESRLAARWLMEEYGRLVDNIKSGDLTMATTQNWDPSSWPAAARGYGYTEAPRGALAHWINIRDGKIANYQCVVPTTWNASPIDSAGAHGAYEAALLDNTRLADPDKPLEILRTIHSFDPCLACATHVFSPTGEKLAEVTVR